MKKITLLTLLIPAAGLIGMQKSAKKRKVSERSERYSEIEHSLNKTYRMLERLKIQKEIEIKTLSKGIEEAISLGYQISAIGLNEEVENLDNLWELIIGCLKQLIKKVACKDIHTVLIFLFENLDYIAAKQEKKSSINLSPMHEVFEELAESIIEIIEFNKNGFEGVIQSLNKLLERTDPVDYLCTK